MLSACKENARKQNLQNMSDEYGSFGKAALFEFGPWEERTDCPHSSVGRALPW